VSVVASGANPKVTTPRTKDPTTLTRSVDTGTRASVLTAFPTAYRADSLKAPPVAARKAPFPVSNLYLLADVGCLRLYAEFVARPIGECDTVVGVAVDGDDAFRSCVNGFSQVAA
jgi:hypothetical protein